MLWLWLSAATALSTEFPAGWNGLAEKPPLAWRSYNAQVAGMPMNQRVLEESIDALKSRNRSVDGVPASLWDVGYRDVGIDGGWELCVNQTMHDEDGNPMINKAIFPNMKGLVDYAHQKDVKIGWYQNNCGCPERSDPRRNYEGDIKMLFELGFDGAKYDRCGSMLNSTLYASLMKATNKSYLIENCHWGICTDDADSSCPTPSRDWCPFNFFRTSGDVRETWNSWTRNLMTAVRFLDADKPLSGPFCWAYPDMLQVGNLATLAHDRAHMGSWIIISAPLYLSFDLRDSRRMDRVWSLVTNREAIAVQQQYAGHPGRLVRAWTPAHPALTKQYIVTADLNSCQRGWRYDASTGHVSLQQDDCTTKECGCLAVPADGTALLPNSPCPMVAARTTGGAPSYSGERYCDDATLLLRPCDPADPLQRFAYSGTPGVSKGLLSINVSQHTLYVRAEPWWEGAGVQLVLQGDRPRPLLFNKSGVLQTGTAFAGDTCINASPTMDDSEALFLWAKPQPGGAVAVLVVNNHPSATFTDISISLSEVGFAGEEAAVRDIWQRADAGQSKQGAVLLPALPPRDSRFLLLTKEASSGL